MKEIHLEKLGRVSIQVTLMSIALINVKTCKAAFSLYYKKDNQVQKNFTPV